MITGKNHPELLEGEVWITNAQEADWNSIGWKTKRAGTTAYDKSGCAITTWGRFFPVFVQRSELEQAGIDPDSLAA